MYLKVVKYCVSGSFDQILLQNYALNSDTYLLFPIQLTKSSNQRKVSRIGQLDGFLLPSEQSQALHLCRNCYNLAGMAYICHAHLTLNLQINTYSDTYKILAIGRTSILRKLVKSTLTS